MKFLKSLAIAKPARLGVYLYALWKLFRHPETPRRAKVVAFCVLAYAISPIDLIPDFIPIIGQLDELILVPLGVALAVKLTPRHLWEARLAEAEANPQRVPRIWWGAAVIVLIWATLLGLSVWGLWAWFGGGASAQ